MQTRSKWARVSIGTLALMMLGCGAPAATTQAPVQEAQATAPTATYSVQQHGGGGYGGRRRGYGTCYDRYQACLQGGYGGYWFFRRRRCTRDYNACTIQAGDYGGYGHDDDGHHGGGGGHRY